VPNNAPDIANLNGDGVTFDVGGPPVRLDALADAAATDADPLGFQVMRVATGLSGGPLFMIEVPDGSGRMYVVEKSGTVRILDPNSGTLDPTPFLSVAGQISPSGEQGLLGMALAPNFATSGIFYIYMTNTNGDNEVRRYSTLRGNLNQADAATADRILLIPHPGATNHNAGWIAFGPDNFLYVASGDGAVGANAQSLNSLLGKILRIDAALDGFPADPDRDYSIPTGNPFAGATAGLDEIWAYGLRNPFRASFDSLNGNLWIGDVGQNVIEEIDFAPAGQGGLNFGWDLREGTLEFGGPNSPAFTPPLTEYRHGDGPFEGNSVTGGLVYRGPIAALDGQYVFGDFFDQLWSISVTALSQGSTLPSDAFTLRNTAFTPDAGAIEQITSFATDQAGNLYITDLGGEIFRVQPSTSPNFAGGRLSVEIGAGEIPAEDRLGFASGAVTLSEGTNFGSQVIVGGVVIGTIAPNGTGVNGEPLVVLFNSGATQARISMLVQAITYSNAAVNPTPGTRSVTIQLADGAGTSAGGHDTAVRTTSVSVSTGAGGTLAGTSANDVLVGGLSGDLLNGGAGNDTLIGAGGNDSHHGGPGMDLMNGGAGNDYYVVDNSDDWIIEAGGDGFDIAFSSISYVLPPGMEIESLGALDPSGSAAFDLTGNGIANRMVGNAASNTLSGGGGADLLYGEGGNDYYIVDNIGDLVLEAAGNGYDIVFATTSYALAAGQQVESLGTLDPAGTAAMILVGNELPNRIVGNAGANFINGGLGADELYGEAGADEFGFTTALGGGNVDVLGDFNSADDTIDLEDAVFTGLAAGALNPNAFVIAATAQDADDRIVYNMGSGYLLFDADGSGPGGAVLFATVQPGTIVTASDLLVI
jgi:Ca2+-binding RTX toxin-like protein